MAINSKVDLCNLALMHLGNFGTVSNLDTPTDEKEITFALAYDISRQTFLKTVMPNFALARKTIAQVVTPPPFGAGIGYQIGYEYPSDCLKVLGIGEVKEKANNYSVEGRIIWTDVDYPNGLPLRYIKDIEDVTSMSPEFKMAFPIYLAGVVVMDITQDVAKANTILKMLPEKMSALSGMNAQENMPIRISHSRFRQSRINGFASEPNKL